MLDFLEKKCYNISINNIEMYKCKGLIMRIINLPKDFVIYAETLTYEYHRYRELIGLIENINYNFSKEERESAIDYYSNLFNEASIPD